MDDPTLVDRPTAAKLLGVRVSTLRRWWSAGRGPAGVKLSAARSGRVYWRRVEIEAYLRDPAAYEAAKQEASK